MKKKTLLFLALIFSCANIVTAKTNFFESNIFEGLAADDKVAILMVHFGTSHNDTRAKTIEALNQKVKVQYPNIEQREAWTSRLVIGIMAKRGENINNPAEALLQLKEDGFTHIIIQSSNVIEGVEMESLRRDVLAAKDDFKEIRVGNPLLYTTHDYQVVVDALREKQPAGSALVLVGHGTYTPATAQYAMVDYVIGDKEYNDMHIGTIEGYPDYDSMLVRLKRENTKNVLLMPFMFVAGEHAKNDIDQDWRLSLEQEGYSVSVLLEGLGEMEAVQDLFLEHIDFAIKHKMYDIIEKKAVYATQK
ncbi:MAG: sirohydrochlorin cobaltochelatase [Rikenellaceae bacterium]